MLHVQNYLNDHSLDDLTNEFGIMVKQYDDRVVLNYSMASKMKYHDIVKECRGLIIDKNFQVISRSFDRFYNYGEGDDKDTFNWDDCKVFNKLDGSLITVYYDNEKWCSATRGTAYAEGNLSNDNNQTFAELFLKAIGDSNLNNAFGNMDVNFSYIFELTSPYNRIVTPYNETKVTLLAIRNKIDGTFVDYDKIENFLKLFKFKTSLPESYSFTEANDIIVFVNNRDQFDEGVVCYDNKTQKRIKIKNPSYVAIHHLRGNGSINLKSVVNLLVTNEMEEYLTYFPNDKELMLPYINKFNALKDDVKGSYEKYKDIKDQKDFAITIKDLPYKGMLFSMRKGVDIDELFKNENFVLKLLS